MLLLLLLSQKPPLFPLAAAPSSSADPLLHLPPHQAVPSWFVKVTAVKDKLLANNAQTYWVPSYVKEKRFHNWLENAHDWNVSRSRFWGTPLPIWASEDGEELVVIGSVEELERLTGAKVTDLHRHFIDDLVIPSKQVRSPLLPRTTTTARGFLRVQKRMVRV